MKFRRQHRSAAVVVAVVVFCVWAAPLLFGLEPVGFDATRGDLPFLCGARRALDDGHWWVSSVLGNGAVLAAEPGSVVLYPVRWLQWLVAPGTARALGGAFHFALLAAGVVVLGRTFALAPVFAACAAVVVVAAGPVVDLAVHTESFTAGLCWFVWSWALARRLRRSRSVGDAAAFIGAVAALELSGDAGGLLIAVVVIAGDVVGAALRERRAGRAGSDANVGVVVVGAAGAVGVAIGFVQTTLVLGEIGLTRRAGGFDVDEALAGAIDRGLWPGLVGAPTHGPWVQLPYVSALLLLLALTQLRRPRAAVVAGVVLLWLSLGKDGVLLELLVRAVPPLLALRYPAKLLPFAVVGLAVAGCGAVARGRVVVVVAAAFAAAVVAAVVAPLHAIAPVVVAGLVWRRHRRSAAAVLALDLVAVAGAHVDVGRPPLQLPNLVFESLGADAVVCVTGPVETQRLPTGDAAVDQIAAWRAYAVPGLSACDGQRNGLPYQTQQSRLSTELEVALDRGVPGAPLALGCSHVVAAVAPPGTAPFPSLLDDVARAHPGAPRLWAVDGALDAVFVVDGARVCADEACALDSIYAWGAVDAAPTTVPLRALVDDPLQRLRGPLPTGSIAARVARDDVEVIVVDVAGSGGGVVGLRRQFLAGWTAEQAGRPLAVVRVYGNDLGVVVDDAGAGPVTLRYRPPHLGAGVAVAVAGGVGAALLLVVLRRRRR